MYYRPRKIDSKIILHFCLLFGGIISLILSFIFKYCIDRSAPVSTFYTLYVIFGMVLPAVPWFWTFYPVFDVYAQKKAQKINHLLLSLWVFYTVFYIITCTLSNPSILPVIDLGESPLRPSTSAYLF